MKTSILTLALALAFSFTATPAAALGKAEKCIVFRAKVERNFSNCMNGAKVREAKNRTTDRADCVAKYDAGITKAKTKFVNETRGVTESECSLQQALTEGVKALNIVASGELLSDYDLESNDLFGSPDFQAVLFEYPSLTSPQGFYPETCTNAGGTYNTEFGGCSVEIPTENAEGCNAVGGVWSQAGIQHCSLLIPWSFQNTCEYESFTWENDTCSCGANCQVTPCVQKIATICMPTLFLYKICINNLMPLCTPD
jgi:hypothetical protein